MTTVTQASGLAGELALSPTIDVPISADIASIQTVDPDPVFTTVSIKAGRGDQGRGPIYGDDMLRSWEQQINAKQPPGFRGHQDPDRVSWEWREPVTAWLGAKFIPGSEPDTGELLVKGYVPPTAGELRQQLALAQAGADLVNSVSVFGTRSIKNDRVESFDLWSIDWTPKGRAGMQTRLVAVGGEQAQEETEMDRAEVIASLRADEVPEAVRNQILAPVAADASAVGEMRVLLELEDTDDPERVVEEVRTLVEARRSADLAQRVDAAIETDGQISGEMVTAAVRDAVLSAVRPGATDEQIAAEIGAAKERPYIAALAKGNTIPVVQGGAPKGTGEQRKGTAWA